MVGVIKRMEVNTQMEEPFGTTRAYDLYVSDFIKGIEMISILLESNEYLLQNGSKISKGVTTIT